MNAKTLTVAGILWLASAVAAFYWGKSQSTSTGGKSEADKASIEGGAGNRTAGPAGNAKSGETGATAEKSLTWPQILAKLKGMMRGGAMQNPAAMMKVMGLLDKIRPEDVQAALAEAETMTDQQQKMMLYMALLGKWAETDAPAAMKYADEHSKSLGMMAQMAKMSVAGVWAEKDPEAVWKWYKDQAEKADGGGVFGGGNMVLVSLFSSLAAQDADKAFQRLQELDGPGKQMAMAGMFQSSLFDEDKRNQLLQKVAGMSDEGERKQAMQMMLGQWAVMAPEEAAKWVKDQPTDQQASYREAVGGALMMSDPKKGASFLMEGATEVDAPRRYADVINRWAALDTNAAGNWLKEQPDGPQLDEARGSFARIAVQKDAVSAMAWAGTVTDPVKRVETTTQVYQTWKQKDATAAEAGLSSSGLTPEQIEQVRSAPAPPGITPPRGPGVSF